MSNQLIKQPETKPESELLQVLNQPHRGTCEYVPYGAQDKIKVTVPIIQNLIAVKTKSGKTCSDRDAIKFLAMCQAKRMNPFEGDCFLIGYDGKDGPQFALVTAHQTYLKRAELHPEFDGMKSGIIVVENEATKDLEGDFFVDGQRVVGGWATVYFKGRKFPMRKRLRLARFQKSFGIWQEDPAGMICKCAEADALRSAFPTMLGGLYLREELETRDAPKTVSTPIFSAPAPESPEPEPSKMPQDDLPPVHTPPEPSKPQDAAKAEAQATQKAAVAPAPKVENGQKPESGAYNYLKAVRGLCKLKGIQEFALLEYLFNTGVLDGAKTLEEVSLQQPEILRLVHDEFDDILGQMTQQDTVQ